MKLFLRTICRTRKACLIRCATFSDRRVGRSIALYSTRLPEYTRLRSFRLHRDEGPSTVLYIFTFLLPSITARIEPPKVYSCSEVLLCFTVPSFCWWVVSYLVSLLTAAQLRLRQARPR